MIENFINPELMILVPVLNIIGLGLKKYWRLNNAYIPIILGILSIFLCTAYFMSKIAINSLNTLMQVIFNSMVQGILAAGASVYFNQIKKQIQNSEVKSLFYKKNKPHS
jgi:hypothetical protein